MTPSFSGHCPSKSFYLVCEQLTERLSDAPLWPLIQHSSHPSETHYFPLAPNSPVLLHTHASAPFVQSAYTRGLNLTVYSTGESGCSVSRLDLTIDWWATIGRWGGRYAAPAVSWAVGVVAILLYDAWRAAETVGTVPSVEASLTTFVRGRLPLLVACTLLVSLLPLPVGMWLGSRGEWILAPIAPLLLVTVTGLVAIIWAAVVMLMWPLKALARRFIL